MEADSLKFLLAAGGVVIALICGLLLAIRALRQKDVSEVGLQTTWKVGKMEALFGLKVLISRNGRNSRQRRE